MNIRHWASGVSHLRELERRMSLKNFTFWVTTYLKDEWNA